MQESRRPKLACEVTANAVVAARRADEGGVIAAAYPMQMRSTMIAPGWRESNVLDGGGLTGALRQALTTVSSGDKFVTLVVPDSAVRVLTLDFDTLPDRERDALPIVRFRLRKLLPFDADTAAISYQTFEAKGQVRAVVAAMPMAIRAEYEQSVRSAGYEPGAILPATVAALPLLNADSATLLVHVAGDSVTIAIVNGETLLLHRVLEIAPDNDEEVAQAIVVARAYFEDTLGSSPDNIVAAGAGSYERLCALLEKHFAEEAHIGLRPLITSSNFLPGALPEAGEREMYGSVAGALN